jgi:hypothetical protein
VPALDLRVEVLQEADPAAVAVRGELEEVELVGNADGAREVGQEDEARLQRGDQDRIAASVVARDLGAELGDAAADLFAGEVDLADAR